jgi:hypothetical protein
MHATKHMSLKTADDVRICHGTTDSYAEFSGFCPVCKAAPFHVAGTGRRIGKDDRSYEDDGVCLECRKYVGLIVVKVPGTLFGLHEDARVLHGPYVGI